MNKHCDPRTAFGAFGANLHRFTVSTDAEIEDQFFDRKEIPIPTTGNVSQNVIRNLKEQIRETVSAFANTNPEGGLLVIGISQTGEIKGINHLTDSQRNELAQLDQLLRNHCASVRLQDCTDFSGSANRLLLVFAPFITDAICETIEGMPRAWKRAGAQNLPLTERDREQIRREKRIEDFERRHASPFRSADLDQEILAEVRKTWPDISHVSRSDEELLLEFGAIETGSGELRFTNAGLLFFASNPQRVMPQAHIRILRYETAHDAANPGDPSLDRTFSGSIPTQLLSAREFLRESGLIRVFQVRRPDGGFDERAEIPFVAVDEAVVNAVAHRDYCLQWPIECIYYTDALVVRNPGRLIQRNGTVPSSFRLDERTLQSTPRNPLLLQWLKQSRDQKGNKFVRALSEGTRAMLRAMTEANLPSPEYTVTDSETLVTLRIDTSLQDKTQHAASEFANLYHLVTSGALPADWKGAALATLRDRLEATEWFIDRFAHSRIVAHRRGLAFPLPDDANNIVRLYPASVFAFRSIKGRAYLIIDYTVEVKSVLTLAALQIRGHSPEDFIRRRVVARTRNGWKNGQIVSLSNEAAQLLLVEEHRTETIPFTAIIPTLGLSQIRKELAATSFDLSAEIKKRSLSSSVGAARKRAETTHLTASNIRETVFPIRLSGVELSLSSEPLRLGSSSDLPPRMLAEPLVEFARHRETSNIRQGITEFGAYSHEDSEIELVPVVADAYREPMRNLIERLKGGAFKYKGAERTFGTRFSYGTIIGVHPTEDLVAICDRVCKEHPAWAGDTSLPRIFLIHAPESGFALDDEGSPYYRAKRLMLEAGIPSQMIDTPTLDNPDWKDLNLALNIAAKCGVVPWVLPEGMPDADFFVGLSYTQHRGDPQTRLMGYANVFNRYGRWLFYSGNVQTFAYQERGQRLAELVESTLRRVESLPGTPHIYFHYSARFSHDDRERLLEAARRVRPAGTYSFVWINSHHPLRLYDERPESDGSLARGAYVVTADNQFYISTTGYNPYRKILGTPVPLEVNVWTYPPFGQRCASADLHALARQILALTKLNWASSDALTGEPITTKYAGDIAYLTAAFMRQGDAFRLHPTLERTPWFL